MNPIKHLVVTHKKDFELLPLIVSHSNFQLVTPTLGNVFYKGYSFLAKEDADKYLHLLTMLNVEAFYLCQVEDTTYLVSSTVNSKPTVHVKVGNKKTPAIPPVGAYTSQEEKELSNILDETLNKILPEVSADQKKLILDRAQMVFNLSKETNIVYQYCLQTLVKHKYNYNSALQELKELAEKCNK